MTGTFDAVIAELKAGREKIDSKGHGETKVNADRSHELT